MRKELAIYWAFFLPIFAAAYAVGRLLGAFYFSAVLPGLSGFFGELVVNWLFWGALTAVSILPLENRYLWGALFTERKYVPGMFNIAPTSLGVLVGFLSRWIY